MFYVRDFGCDEQINEDHNRFWAKRHSMNIKNQNIVRFVLSQIWMLAS